MAGEAASTPVELDGSEGEGGGQILRSALSLSLITGRPFTIHRIRAGRKPPGLRPQHLACVRGAEAISGGRSEGAEVGASTLSFTPGPVKPGTYLIDIGTAGSTPLLFQCLFFPLALAGGGELDLHGGTHLPQSPSYHYLAWIWLPVMNAYGLRAELHLKRAGFYPQGAGEIRAVVPPPAAPPALVHLPSRGTLGEMAMTSFVSGLSLDIAVRQADAAVHALREKGIYCTAEHLPLPASRSKGTAVLIRGQFEHTIAGFTALGERGKRAEAVGREAADQVIQFMAGGGALEEHMGDQLLLPAALLAAGRLGPPAPGTTRFTTSRVTPHLTTNALVIQRFLPVAITISPGGEVLVAPAGAGAGQGGAAEAE